MSKKASKNEREEEPEVLDETPADINAELTEENAEATFEEESASAEADESLLTALKSEKDRYLRLYADFDNFKKTKEKERKEQYAKNLAETVLRFLPIYDNLERALKQATEDEAFYKGIEMTMTTFTEILTSMGVTVIGSIGEKFDPINLHEALAQVENPEFDENTIIEVVEKGFLLGERAIRHAKVVVAK